MNHWIQPELSERIQIWGLPCSGKSTICQRIAREEPGVVFLEEPFNLVRSLNNRSSFSVSFAQWVGYAVKKMDRDGVSFKIVIEERGALDNVVFSVAMMENGEISADELSQRCAGWDADVPSWIVLFKISPEEAARRAISANRFGKHEQLPFLEKLAAGYNELASKLTGRCNLEIMDMSGGIGRNYNTFRTWFREVRY